MEAFLKESGVREPEAVQIAKAESLVFSDNPSARARFPGGVTIGRNYDRLEVIREAEMPAEVTLVPGEIVLFGDYRITCAPADAIVNTENIFTVSPAGPIRVRSRQSGDDLRLPGGTKSVKKRFIDKKIPASQRAGIPVLTDDLGILAVAELGAHLPRRADTLPAITIHIVNTSES